jgi:hypothetical protein
MYGISHVSSIENTDDKVPNRVLYQSLRCVVGNKSEMPHAENWVSFGQLNPLSLCENSWVKERDIPQCLLLEIQNPLKNYHHSSKML